MSTWNYIRERLRYFGNIYDAVDTVSAAERIKSGIWFRGPNVWILAFSIVVASVGLNVNSTAVIIGAMLISPLMGPIMGVGFALGTNDLDLLTAAAKNLLVMVLIALAASALYFILSPLSLVNPTELEARTSPSIYDVLIAFFGGLAGILENSRKEQGTVLAGVAIATALMPPLCTAGYGLAHMNMHFFIGALFLFIINAVFIILATFLMVKYLRFRTVAGIDERTAQKRRRMMTTILILVLVPSILSAISMIGNNNFQRNVDSFVSANRVIGRSYIYDWKISKRNVDISIAGEPMTQEQLDQFYESAKTYHIKPEKIRLSEHSVGLTQDEVDQLIQDIYDRSEREIAEREASLQELQKQVDALSDQVQWLMTSSDSLRTR